MKTALKILLGIVLGMAVLIGGCAALLGSAVNDIEEIVNKPAIAASDFRSVKTGSKGNTRKRIEARFGEPQTQADIDARGIESLRDPGPELDCLYYNNAAELGGLYQFCFDTQTERVKSKGRY